MPRYEDVDQSTLIAELLAESAILRARNDNLAASLRAAVARGEVLLAAVNRIERR